MAATNINRVIITGNLTVRPRAALPAERHVRVQAARRLQHAPQGQRHGRVGRQAQLLRRHRLGRAGRELRPLPVQGPPGRGRRSPRVARVGVARRARSARRSTSSPTRCSSSAAATTTAAAAAATASRRAPTSPSTRTTSPPRPAGGGGGVARRRPPTTTSRSRPHARGACRGPTPDSRASATRRPVRAQSCHNGRSAPPVRGASVRPLTAHDARIEQHDALPEARISPPWRSSATVQARATARQEGRPRQRPAQALPVLQGQDRAGRLQGRRRRCAASSPSAARSARAASPAPAAATRARSPARSSAPASSRCCPTSPRRATSDGDRGGRGRDRDRDRDRER